MNRRETVSDPRVGRMETIPRDAWLAAILPFASGVLSVLNARPVPDA
jgi:hypothetical protein